MHSSSADCVFGDARFTSSTSRRFAKTGPCRKSNSFVRWSKTLTPVMSVGSRSGVNWIRENVQSSERASAFDEHRLPDAREVLDDQVALADEAEDDELQRLHVGVDDARDVLDDAVDRPRGGRRVDGPGLSASIQQRDRLVEHRGRDPRLRRLGDALLPLARDQDHLVVLRVEADVGSGHIVVDDEIDVLVREHRALPLEPALAALGAEGDDHLAVLAPGGERLDDVLGRLELDRPRLGVLRALRLRGLGGPVVGDGGGHEDEIDVRTGQRLVQERLRGRRLDDLDAVRRLDGEVRREQRDAGAAAAGLLGERDAHPAGGAVADEADGVERLARAAGRDEDASCPRGPAARAAA